MNYRLTIGKRKTLGAMVVALGVFSALGFKAQAQDSAPDDFNSDLHRVFSKLDVVSLSNTFTTLASPHCQDMIGTWKVVGWAHATLGKQWLKNIDDVNSGYNVGVNVSGQCANVKSSLTSQTIEGPYLGKGVDLSEIPEETFTKEPPQPLYYSEKENAYRFVSPLVWAGTTKGNINIYLGNPSTPAQPDPTHAFAFTCKAVSDTKYRFALCTYAVITKDQVGPGHYKYHDEDPGSHAYALMSDGQLATVTDEIQEEKVDSVLQEEKVHSDVKEESVNSTLQEEKVTSEITPSPEKKKVPR